MALVALRSPCNFGVNLWIKKPTTCHGRYCSSNVRLLAAARYSHRTSVRASVAGVIDVKGGVAKQAPKLRHHVILCSDMTLVAPSSEPNHPRPTPPTTHFPPHRPLLTTSTVSCTRHHITYIDTLISRDNVCGRCSLARALCVPLFSLYSSRPLPVFSLPSLRSSQGPINSERDCTPTIVQTVLGGWCSTRPGV